MKYSIFKKKKSKTVHILYEKKSKTFKKKMHSICTRYKGRYKNNCINKKT